MLPFGPCPRNRSRASPSSSTSPWSGTEDYDRGTKFAHYRTLPSLAEYVLVAQDKVHVEHFVRQAEGWLLTETDDLAATLDLPSIGCTLALADVYERVFGRE